MLNGEEFEPSMEAVLGSCRRGRAETSQSPWNVHDREIMTQIPRRLSTHPITARRPA